MQLKNPIHAQAAGHSDWLVALPGALDVLPEPREIILWEAQENRCLAVDGHAGGFETEFELRSSKKIVEGFCEG